MTPGASPGYPPPPAPRASRENPAGRLHPCEVTLLHQRQHHVERRVPHRLVEELDHDRARVPGVVYGLTDPTQRDHAVPPLAVVHPPAMQRTQPYRDVETDERPVGSGHTP